MALDGTNSGMIASIGDFLNRADLSATIPDFIVLAEADLNRKLRSRLMTAVVSSTITAQYDTAPSDFAGAISMKRADGRPLNVRSIDAIDKLTADNSGGSGTLTDYAVVGSAFQFYPIPAVSQTVTMAYYQKVPGLALNPTGNWLSKAHPDAYLYGALTAASPYLQDDERVAVWSGLYQNAIETILIADQERFGERLSMQPSATQIV